MHRRNEEGMAAGEAVIGCGVMVFIALLLITTGIGVAVASYGVDWFTAPFKGAQAAHQTIQADGDFRIAAYTKFYNDCASIQALENEIDGQMLALQTSSPGDQRIINANLAALSGSRDASISRYNTESHKQWTIAQFKSKSLAFELPTSSYLTYNAAAGTYVKGVKTTCVVS